MADGEGLVGLFAAYELVKRTAHLEGDLVECGVGYGRSLLHLVAIISALGLKKVIHGYDSFQGFPDPSPEDNSYRKPKKGEWSDASEQGVYERFVLSGMEHLFVKHVVLHKGFFAETLPKTLPAKVSFLHLDCDLYQSYRVALEHCYPRCQRGAIILFDEYNLPAWPGAKKAVDEFFADKAETITFFNGVNRYGTEVVAP